MLEGLAGRAWRRLERTSLPRGPPTWPERPSNHAIHLGAAEPFHHSAYPADALIRRQDESTASTLDSVDALFERVGGEQFFIDLVEAFYLGVAGDPLLRPLYPDDLTESSAHLALFLVQYWGGPGTYSEQRGHPRLRMRHAPFVIGPPERDAWLRHMLAALSDLEEVGRIRSADAVELRDYLAMAANSLVNAP
jgi:hemoglobin